MQKVIAIDFDGTLCENKYPEIGLPRWGVIFKALSEQENGAALILWTCRTGMEMGGLKANYPALKEACMEMRQMIMQKTAGQRKDRPKDIPWENWERVKVTIICEAMALVLSGEYEPKEEGKSERKTVG